MCYNPLFHQQILLQHPFLKSTAIILQDALSVLLKNELLWHSSNSSVTIIPDHTRWSFTRNRKQKFKQWSFIREVLKQYLTEKQNGYFHSGCSSEVVAYEKWLLWESWLSYKTVSLFWLRALAFLYPVSIK